MAESPVFMFDNSDPEMQHAYAKARESFRYFWREVAWERRRIVPALKLACVKAAFSDAEKAPRNNNTPQVEHMWLSEIDFDGEAVGGKLLNAPNWLKTIKQGDSARIPLGQISDWMYAIGNDVFGAYTVNLLRSRMGAPERRQHDAAWGLNFGDPTKIRVAPEPNNKGGGILKNWFGKNPTIADEHPMSINMASSLKDQLTKNPSLVSSKDKRGWTLLHQEALAGSAPTVKVLLEAGADRSAVTSRGWTALKLAKSLGWQNVVTLLETR